MAHIDSSDPIQATVQLSVKRSITHEPPLELNLLLDQEVLQASQSEKIIVYDQHGTRVTLLDNELRVTRMRHPYTCHLTLTVNEQTLTEAEDNDFSLSTIVFTFDTATHLTLRLQPFDQESQVQVTQV